MEELTIENVKINIKHIGANYVDADINYDLFSERKWIKSFKEYGQFGYNPDKETIAIAVAYKDKVHYFIESIALLK